MNYLQKAYRRLVFPLLTLGTLVFLVLTNPGCTVVGDGSLSVTWTIASKTDSSLCSTYGADHIVVQLYDENNNLVGSAYTAPCSNMEINITGLDKGNYKLTAIMADSSGSYVSTSVGPYSISIENDKTTSYSLNFTAASFEAAANGGTIQISWTIDSTTTSSKCSSYSANHIALQLYDEDGNTYGSKYTQPCSDFTSIISDIPAGTYTLKARMEDSDDVAVSSWLGPVALTVTSSSTASHSFDFSDSSFSNVSSDTTGTLTVNWTISSSTSSSYCTDHSAESISLQLYTEDGEAYGSSFTSDCTNFTTALSDIPTGTYILIGQLLNSDKVPVSSKVELEAVTVSTSTTTSKTLNFATSTFNTGTLHLSWTIASTSSTAQCSDRGIDQIEFYLLDENQQHYGDTLLYTSACTSFITSVSSLPVGNYTVRAMMINSSSEALSNSITSDSFNITADTITPITINFPSSAF